MLGRQLRGPVPHVWDTARHFSLSRSLNACTVKPVESLAPRIKPHFRPVSDHPFLHSLAWDTPPRNVFIVKKPWTDGARNATVEIMNHFRETYKDVNIILEPGVAEELEHSIDGDVYTTPSSHALHEKTDLLVTIGGDGTILHATSLFADADVPPVVSFSMGTLGFLMPFDAKDAASAIRQVMTSQSRVMNRFRLHCETVRKSRRGAAVEKRSIYAMNDLNIHRGQDPHLTLLDITVNGQFVTRAIADGVIVSTPTGSTAYSLSAGGSIVHPAVSCILITPICPRSLSFRPLVFPSNASISIAMSPKSRGQLADLSIDGISRGTLRPGDTVHVHSERGVDKGIWCVVRTGTDWVRNLNGLLGFNSTFGVRHT